MVIIKYISLFDSNSVGSVQKPCSVASDQGLHLLQISLLWDARYKWVKG